MVPIDYKNGQVADPDPLADFQHENHVAASVQKSAGNPKPAIEVPRGDVEIPRAIRERLQRTEAALAKTQLAVAALQTDLATLVAAVEDFRRQRSRLPPPPSPVRLQKSVQKRAVLGVVLLLAAAAASWAIAATAIVEETPVHIESDSAVAPLVPAPAAADPAPAVELATVAGVAPPPVRKQVVREPSRQSAYVGTLSIDAEPAGEVFINRQVAGRTPLRAENLRAGSHLIWIEREGYRRWTRVVAVAADRVTRVSAELAPLSR